MRETDKSIEIIIQDMLSGRAEKIWSAGCAICSLSQNHEKILELLPYEQQMADATKGIDLGGALVPNKRFLKRAFEIMDFHKDNNDCSCCLLFEDDNPVHLVEDGYFTLMDTVYMSGSNYIDYYVVGCKNCGNLYQVGERVYHYPWWDWQLIGKEGQVGLFT